MPDTAETLRAEWERQQSYILTAPAAANGLIKRLLAALTMKELEVSERSRTVEGLQAALERAEQTFRSYRLEQSAEEVAAVLKETKQ